MTLRELTGWDQYIITVSNHATVLKHIVITQSKWPYPSQYRGFNDKPRSKA